MAYSLIIFQVWSSISMHRPYAYFNQAVNRNLSRMRMSNSSKYGANVISGEIDRDRENLFMIRYLFLYNIYIPLSNISSSSEIDVSHLQYNIFRTIHSLLFIIFLYLKIFLKYIKRKFRHG